MNAIKFLVLLNLVILQGSLANAVYAQQDNKSAIAGAAQSTDWNSLSASAAVGFVSSAIRLPQDVPVKSVGSIWKQTTWKNEKTHTQIAVSTKTAIKDLRIIVDDLSDGQGHRILKQHISTGFLRYVITDEFRNGCGHRKPEDFDSSYVADIIDTSAKNISVNKNSTQPVWISIKTPVDAMPGIYKGSIIVLAGRKYTLQVEVKVTDRAVPDPSDWKYDLDLWQHPAAIARVHKLALWSDEHFAAMRKYYTALAQAGQKTITTSIVDEPWGHQTYDDFPSLIKWTKKKDGSWSYDYSLFDKYVSFVMSCGIDKRISCFSMVPWKIALRYFDEALGRDTVFTGAIGTASYNQYWSAMLNDFTKHLKNKNWFSITYIAMDERPMPAMQAVISLLKNVDKDWKISLAGDYHPEIEKDIFNYCVASRWQYPDSVLARRNSEGKISTWYTCCTEKYPNGFTFSPPDEHVWIGWYTAAKNMDGYLRWAFNSWPKDPLKDSRFTAWPAGDTYQIYPGPFSSVRFEKMIEGIQDFEKITLLRNEYKKTGNNEKLRKLEQALANFGIDKLQTKSAQSIVGDCKILLQD